VGGGGTYENGNELSDSIKAEQHLLCKEGFWSMEVGR
jgi:hypothetical protein